MSATREDIQEQIIASVEAFGISGHPIDLDTQMDDLGIDVPDLVEITDLAKYRWGIEMTTDDLDSAETVGQMVDFISGKAGLS
jgi:acyl carrier protein